MKKHLTAYSFHSYHLSSPSFQVLLKLRIDSAAHAAVEAANNNAKATKYEKKYGEIVNLFRLLRRSLLGKNKNIIRLVESVAYGNMRLALKLFNSFITSGATNMPKILGFYNKGVNYTVPFHEFTKSIMLGDYRYYKEDRSPISSPIANLFTVARQPWASHFTALRMLQYLASSADPQSHGKGFVNLHELVTKITDIFRNEEDCRATLLRLIAVDRQLIDLDSRQTDTLAGAGGVRITTAGKYYLGYLVRAFAYLDLVWHDTPFSDQAVADKLTRMISETTMQRRFDRVSIFIDYLEAEEDSELAEYGLDKTGEGFWGPFMPSIRTQVEKEKVQIRKRWRENRRVE